jgi:hypothetical protein
MVKKIESFSEEDTTMVVFDVIIRRVGGWFENSSRKVHTKTKHPQKSINAKRRPQSEVGRANTR